jgi:excisionase family DNA binding protein
VYVSGVVIEGYVRVTEAAAQLGISRRRILQLINEGRLQAEPLGPRFLVVERASVEEYQRLRRPAGRPRRANSTDRD